MQKSLDWESGEMLVEQASSQTTLETEMPEDLYIGMNEFLTSNKEWNQEKLISSALVNFLYQNGCSDRSVVQSYLNNLFCRSSELN